MVQKNLVYVYKTIFLKFTNSFKNKAEDRLNSFIFYILYCLQKLRSIIDLLQQRSQKSRMPLVVQ